MLLHAYKSFGAKPANIMVMTSEAEYLAVRNGAFGGDEELQNRQICPAGNPQLNLLPLPEDFIPFRKFTHHLAG